MVIKYWKRWSGRAAVVTTIVIALAGAALVASTPAQTQDSDEQNAFPLVSVTPSALFQFSTLTGSADTMTAQNVPVVTSTGSLVYKNVTAQFNVNSAGNLSLAAGFPKITSVPAPPFNAFKAGNYVGPSTLGSGKFLITVGGPTKSPGGSTWGSTAAAGADAGTYPFSCSWYDGPIANNPNAGRLKAAGITSTALSYGTCSAPCPNATGTLFWCPGTLAGVSQAGQVITFYSFSSDGSPPHGGEDFNGSVDTIAYTLLH